MHTVIETPAFIAASADAGMSTDEIAAFVSKVAERPDMGDLMKGTGGARKVRVAGRGKGKSGGYRIITFYAAADVPVFLLDCYGKGDQASLSMAERNELRTVLAEIADAYRAGARAATKRRI